MRRVIVVLLIALLPLFASAQDAAALRAGVVKIKSSLNNKLRTGSGFVVSVDGNTTYIVTAAHVVEGDASPKVEFYARQNAPVDAEVIKQELRVDLAVLKVASAPQATVLAFESAAKPKIGDEVVAFGFPQGGGSWLMSKADLAGREGPDLVFSGAAIDQGNSGGPLIKDGKVIAVVQALQGKFARAAPASLVVETLEGWGIALNAHEPAAAAAQQAGSRQDSAAAMSNESGADVARLKQAAEGGNARAQAMLAETYYEGNGVTQSFAEAAKWYRLAANAGDAEAQFAVGAMALTRALGRAHDDESALRAVKASDESSVPMFDNSQRAEVKDQAALRESVEWLTKSAQQGFPAAQLLLAALLSN